MPGPAEHRRIEGFDRVRVNGRIGVLYSNKDYGCEWDYDFRNKRFLAVLASLAAWRERRWEPVGQVELAVVVERGQLHETAPAAALAFQWSARSKYLYPLRLASLDACVKRCRP